MELVTVKLMLLWTCRTWFLLTSETFLSLDTIFMQTGIDYFVRWRTEQTWIWDLVGFVNEFSLIVFDMLLYFFKGFFSGNPLISIGWGISHELGNEVGFTIFDLLFVAFICNFFLRRTAAAHWCTIMFINGRTTVSKIIWHKLYC